MRYPYQHVFLLFVERAIRSTFSVMLLLCTTICYGQQLVTQPMTGTPAAGSYYNPSSITINAPFSFTAQPDQSLHLYIAPGPDCLTLSTQPSNSQNYIVTYVPRDSSLVNPADPTLSSCQVIQTIEYLDGLGRPSQTIHVKGSANGFDVVQPVVYDQYGREGVKYLPYTINSTTPGSFRSDPITEQASFYHNQGQGYQTTDFPYTQTVFESSPLNRALQQGAPGNDWQPLNTANVNAATAGHTVNTDYGVNADSEVKLWQYNNNGNGAGWNNSYYGAGQLYKTTITDENGHPVVEYKDKEGHVVCKKAAGRETYYIYDSYENLAYVVPPISQSSYPASFTEASTDANFNTFVYAYHYDGRNRVVEKKIPGKDWEYMVYNSLDQVVLTQDGVLRNQSPQQWLFTKYDAQGRVVITGLYSDDQHSPSAAGTNYRNDLQTAVTNNAAMWESPDNTQQTGYSNKSFPKTGIATNLTINYYDNYSFSGNPYASTATLITSQTTGMLTASQRRILNADGTYGGMLWTVNYYDDYGRIRETSKQNNVGGYDRTVYDYNFNNEVINSVRTHNSSSVQNLVITNRYEYDHMGRKLKTYQRTGSATSTEVLLARTDYNEVGQIMGKHLHSTDDNSFFQDINYSYNERGWLTSSASSIFSMQLKYNAPSATYKQWNGNIAEQDWSTQGGAAKNYVYQYDELNRLTFGTHSAGYSETDIGYDDLGNIQHLTRSDPNAGTVTYNYQYINNGNQLLSVDQFTGGNYTYDRNGNMTHDSRNGTDISYNLLNLPRNLAGKNLSYTYDATGQKLNKNNGSISSDYIDGIQYDNGQLGFIQTEEGRVIKTGSDLSTNWNYEYYLSDHLGNIRASFQTASGAVDVKQTDDYYPFGKEILTSNYPSLKNEYLYNKKEQQPETGDYDYGARYYDPVIGRWTSLDPLAEINRKSSPYNYGADNSIRNIDPDGMSEMDFNFDELKEGGNIHNIPDFSFSGNISSPFDSRRHINRENMKSGFGDVGGNDEGDGFNFHNRFKPHYIAGVGGKKGDGKGKGKDNSSSNGRNTSQDKKLTPGDIKNLQEQGWDHREKGDHGGQTDLFKDKDGNVYQKPKNGKGPGEPIGYNLNDNMVSHHDTYIAPGSRPAISPVVGGFTLGGAMVTILEYGWVLAL